MFQVKRGANTVAMSASESIGMAYFLPKKLEDSSVSNEECQTTGVDRRAVVHLYYGNRPDVLKMTPWKNYFMVHSYGTEASHSTTGSYSTGTAFLTNLDREVSGVRYRILLTAAHLLYDKKYRQRCSMIELYHGYHLARQEQPLVFHVMSAEHPEGSLGWYRLSEDYFCSQDSPYGSDSDYGAIYIEEDFMRRKMEGLGGLEEAIMVRTDDDSFPAMSITEIDRQDSAFVAGFGKKHNDMPNKHLLISDGNAVFPQHNRPVFHNYAPVLLEYEMDTSAGESGTAVVQGQPPSRSDIAIGRGADNREFIALAIHKGCKNVRWPSESPAHFAETWKRINIGVPITRQLVFFVKESTAEFGGGREGRPLVHPVKAQDDQGSAGGATLMPRRPSQETSAVGAPLYSRELLKPKQYQGDESDDKVSTNLAMSSTSAPRPVASASSLADPAVLASSEWSSGRAGGTLTESSVLEVAEEVGSVGSPSAPFEDLRRWTGIEDIATGPSTGLPSSRPSSEDTRWQITDEQISKLGKSWAAQKWEDIAENLPNLAKPDKPRAFDFVQINDFDKPGVEKKKILKTMLADWIQISPAHDQKALFDVLRDDNVRLLRVAIDVFGDLSQDMTKPQVD